MASSEFNYKLRKLEETIIHVSITTEFKARFWVASQLLKLAAFILGAELDIKCKGFDEGDL